MLRHMTVISKAKNQIIFLFRKVRGLIPGNHRAGTAPDGENGPWDEA